MAPEIRTTTMTSWDDIVSFFPKNWRETAGALQVMKGARRDKCLDATMHTLLMHLACGFSLKETVTRARLGGKPLYTSSHVALRDRLIKFKPLFRELCLEMLDPDAAGFRGRPAIRLIDATDIQENGPTGSLWRFHYSFSLPSLTCDFTKLTATRGAGTGENLTQFPLSEGEHVMADRGYSRATGITYAERRGAKVCVRLNYGSLKLLGETGKPFGLVAKLGGLRRGGEASEWPCSIRSSDDGSLIHGRICAIRKTEAQIADGRRRIKEMAWRSGKKTSPDTWFVNEYVVLFTTFERDAYPLRTVLEMYRWRWQIELHFKRLKSLIQFGHLPTRGDESSTAWLYGKMFVALLIEQISRAGSGSFSPWREGAIEEGVREPMEAVRFSRALSCADADAADDIV